MFCNMKSVSVTVGLTAKLTLAGARSSWLARCRTHFREPLRILGLLVESVALIHKRNLL